MATFKVQTVRVLIEEHPNADALELARVGDYRSVVRKGQFKSGDLVAYIPEQAIVPAPLLEELGLTGRLAGKDKDRVKAIRLRGVLSQGLCYPARETWSEGQDVGEELGLSKYEPPVPTHMAGNVYGAGPERCVRYDIENFQRYPEVLVAGEEVVFTEKIHGTWCQIGVMPTALADAEHGPLVVSSKG
ncbi:MAG: RNA ligase (ATP), partial [Myxococcales bacterium]|nr:RNA ligase (ATP) [Myxococcales bacterium]